MLHAASFNTFSSRGFCFQVLLAHRHLFCLAAASLGAAAGCSGSPFNRCWFELFVRPVHAPICDGAGTRFWPDCVICFCKAYRPILPGRLEQAVHDVGMLFFDGISLRTPRKHPCLFARFRLGLRNPALRNLGMR